MQNTFTNIAPNKRKQLTNRVGWVSIIINVLLFILKYWAGIVSGSVALVADAWHTLSDSITSVIILISGKISSKPADHEHPYGHGRIELIAAIVIGVFLLIIAFNFIEEAINKISSKEAAEYGWIAITVTCSSILLKEILARFTFKIGKQLNSPAIKADGWHHRSDALSSVVILIGIFFNPYFWWMDAVLGICVALFLIYATYEILKTSIDHLLGKQPDKATIKILEKICLELGGNQITPHHFHFHEYGNHTEITFHIQFPEDVLLDEAHTVANNIEKKIRLELQYESTIHMEPYNSIDD